MHHFYRSSRLLAVFIIILKAASVHAAPAVSEVDIHRAMANLTRLAGTWRVIDSQRDFSIVFESIANDNAVTETWFYGKQKHSLTIYHLDNHRLIATHYCPLGNQPRLALTPSEESDVYRFEFFDATGLVDLNDNHQHALSLHLPTVKNPFKRTESYLHNGDETLGTLLLERTL